MSLTPGAIERLVTLEGKQNDPSFMPTLQVIKVIPVSGANSSNERFRTILSDGKHFVQGMLATQQNQLIHSKQVMDNTIIKLNDFMNNNVKGKIVIIVLGLEVINKDPGEKIGMPVELGNVMSNTPSATPPQPMYNNVNKYNSSGAGQKPDNVSSNNNNSYNNKPSSNPYGQAQNRYGSSQNKTSAAPVMRQSTSATGQPITPIAGLNMYQNRWTIKARVTNKGDIRSWSNAKGEGTLFSMSLLDSSGTDIRATMFKEAVEKFHGMLEEDKVYSFSGGRLKVANAQYNTCKSGFEITFDQNSEIRLDNDSGDIQQQIYEFVKIAALEQTDPNTNVDLLAVVKSVGPVTTIISKKTGNEIPKAEIVLVDDSGTEVNCTVWGDRSQKVQTEYQGNPILALRQVRVSDFGGRSVSAGGGSSMTIDPRVPELAIIREWWNRTKGEGGRSLSAGTGAGRFPTFEERKNIAAIKGEALGTHNPDKPDWLSFKGTFSFIKSDKEGGAWYTACPNAEEPCKNRYKVEQSSDGAWFCERCNRSYDTCKRKFIFSATVVDDSSTSWVSLFDDQAKILFGGVEADDVYKQREEGNNGLEEYNALFTKASFTDWVFNCKVKQEMVQEELRIKTTVYSMHPMDYAAEGKSLLTEILKME